ncbi:hypothetical protein DB347_01615 [Opitutaceae bacterium EW11]|nr:hypothetical protein DB347_01615 [Opitutaceae bacterium EW11]
MKPFARLTNRYWIGGAITAFVGVGLARILSPTLERGPREITAAAGQLLGILGLFIIAYGVNRRLKAGTSKEGLKPE